MAKVKLIHQSLSVHRHTSRATGNDYTFPLGRFLTIDNAEDVKWFSKFPQRYEVETIASKAVKTADSVIDTVKKKVGRPKKNKIEE